MSPDRISMPGLAQDTPQAPQPKPQEPNEKARRQADKFFMFHDFDKDPLFNCPHGAEGARNLVLCIDGTANQFSARSSNIVEIYSRLIRLVGVQLSFYNSGIGTYAKPSFRSWKYFKQVADHTIDTAIAWNFETIVHAAYKWLSETYEPGDRIFMFGFSRGAYQVRVLAGMIEKVGLLHKGSDNQIPFAYELYASAASSKRNRDTKGKNVENTESAEDLLCRQFKSTLCHENVKVHFVGAWDTVSSIGLLRSKALPETVSGMGHVCSFRHALALDERRVKFQPEYANGGLGPREGDSRGDVKEVWFAGTHSDVGGGNIANPDLANFSPSLRWMMQEATKRGLRLKSTTKHWEPLPLTKSLKWFWLPLEVLPIRSLSYKNEGRSTWQPHLCAGRRVQRGQRIHHTVFTHYETSDGQYRPKATPPPGFHDWGSFFKQYSPSKDDPISEFDPFENAASFLCSLEEACATMSISDNISEETIMQYSHSILALRSFLETHTSRQTSINELLGVEKVLLSALDLSLRRKNTMIGINTADLKATLIRLLAAVNLTETQVNPGYGSKASEIRRWAGAISTRYKPALRIVLNHFACVYRHRWGKYIHHVAFSKGIPHQVIFNTLGSGESTYTSIWDGSIRPPKTSSRTQGERSTISRDGVFVAVGYGREISITDTTKHPPSVVKCLDQEDPTDSKDISSLSFSDDQQMLATGHEKGWIKLWRQENGRWKVFKRIKGGNQWISRPTFSRDGSQLAFKAELVKVWRFFDDTLFELQVSLESWSIAWSPSENWIVSGTRDRVEIWIPDQEKVIHTFKAHDDYIWCLAFRDDGQVLATGSDDHKIRVWRCDTWEKVWEFDIGEAVTSMAFSPDGKQLISGGYRGALHLWDVDMGGGEEEV